MRQDMSQRQELSQVIDMGAMATFANLRQACASWGHTSWTPIIAMLPQRQGMAILDQVGEPLRTQVLALPDSAFSLAPGMLDGNLGRNVRNLVICAVAQGQVPWWAGRFDAGINPDRWAACWPGRAFGILRDLDDAGIVPFAASDYDLRVRCARRETRENILRDLAYWLPFNPSSRPQGIRPVDRDQAILDAIFADVIPVKSEPMTVGIECELAFEEPECSCQCDCEKDCDCDQEDYCTCSSLHESISRVIDRMRRKGWECRECCDSSIHPEGREFVSPPLPLEKAGEWLRDLLRAAYREGFYGNDSCGIHVHLGIQNLGVKKWGGCAEGREFWREFQIEFCRKLQEIEHAGTCWIPDCRQHSEYCCYPWDGVSVGNKYNALNVHTNYETVEIRRFGFEDESNLHWLANQTDEFQDILNSLCSQFGFLGQLQTWDESEECRGMHEKGIRGLRAIKDRILEEQRRIRQEEHDREMAPYRRWAQMMRDLACELLAGMQAQPGFGLAESRVILDEMLVGIPRNLNLAICPRILSQQNSVPSLWDMTRWAQNLSAWCKGEEQVLDVLDSAGSRIKNAWLSLAERMQNQFSSVNSSQIPCGVA